MTRTAPNIEARRVALRELPDEQLAQRAREGSGASFALLVSRYEGRLYNFLLRRVGRAADAEDLAQEAFVRAWRRIDRYDPRWRFSTWLFTIASRLASNHMRRERGRRGVEREHAARRPSPTATGDAFDGEARAALWAAAASALTDAQRTALWLRYSEDMAMADIGRVMGKTSIGVRAMLFRARSALAEQMVETACDRPAQPVRAPALEGAS